MAASTSCKICYGIEKADTPNKYAENMNTIFQTWLRWYGKKSGEYLLIKGDFLSDNLQEKINNATIIFANNFAFGPSVDHKLKEKFSELQDGTKIISSKSFCSTNFRLSDRNLSDIGAIMNIVHCKIFGSVSWTDKPIQYYLQVIDRSKLEKYFESLKSPPSPKNISKNDHMYNDFDSYFSTSPENYSSNESESPFESPSRKSKNGKLGYVGPNYYQKSFDLNSSTDSRIFENEVQFNSKISPKNTNFSNDNNLTNINDFQCMNSSTDSEIFKNEVHFRKSPNYISKNTKPAYTNQNFEQTVQNLNLQLDLGKPKHKKSPKFTGLGKSALSKKTHISKKKRYSEYYGKNYRNIRSPKSPNTNNEKNVPENNMNVIATTEVYTKSKKSPKIVQEVQFIKSPKYESQLINKLDDEKNGHHRKEKGVKSIKCPKIGHEVQKSPKIGQEVQKSPKCDSLDNGAKYGLHKEKDRKSTKGVKYVSPKEVHFKKNHKYGLYKEKGLKSKQSPKHKSPQIVEEVHFIKSPKYDSQLIENDAKYGLHVRSPPNELLAIDEQYIYRKSPKYYSNSVFSQSNLNTIELNESERCLINMVSPNSDIEVQGESPIDNSGIVLKSNDPLYYKVQLRQSPIYNIIPVNNDNYGTSGLPESPVESEDQIRMSPKNVGSKIVDGKCYTNIAEINRSPVEFDDQKSVAINDKKNIDGLLSEDSTSKTSSNLCSEEHFKSSIEKSKSDVKINTNYQNYKKRYIATHIASNIDSPKLCSSPFSAKESENSMDINNFDISDNLKPKTKCEFDEIITEKQDTEVEKIDWNNFEKLLHANSEILEHSEVLNKCLTMKNSENAEKSMFSRITRGKNKRKILENEVPKTNKIKIHKKSLKKSKRKRDRPIDGLDLLHNVTIRNNPSEDETINSRQQSHDSLEEKSSETGIETPVDFFSESATTEIIPASVKLYTDILLKEMSDNIHNFEYLDQKSTSNKISTEKLCSETISNDNNLKTDLLVQKLSSTQSKVGEDMLHEIKKNKICHKSPAIISINKKLLNKTVNTMLNDEKLCILSKNISQNITPICQKQANVLLLPKIIEPTILNEQASQIETKSMPSGSLKIKILNVDGVLHCEKLNYITENIKKRHANIKSTNLHKTSQMTTRNAARKTKSVNSSPNQATKGVSQIDNVDSSEEIESTVNSTLLKTVKSSTKNSDLDNQPLPSITEINIKNIRLKQHLTERLNSFALYKMKIIDSSHNPTYTKDLDDTSQSHNLTVGDTVDNLQTDSSHNPILTKDLVDDTSKSQNLTVGNTVDNLQTDSSHNPSFQGSNNRIKEIYNPNLCKIDQSDILHNRSSQIGTKKCSNNYISSLFIADHLQKLLDCYRDQFIKTLKQMKDPNYKKQLETQIQNEKERKILLMNKISELNTEISELLGEGIFLLKGHFTHLNINATPKDLFAAGKDIVHRNIDLKSQLSRLQIDVSSLEQEKSVLVSERTQEIFDKSSYVNMNDSSFYVEAILTEAREMMQKNKDLREKAIKLEDQLNTLEKHQAFMLFQREKETAEFYKDFL